MIEAFNSLIETSRASVLISSDRAPKGLLRNIFALILVALKPKFIIPLTLCMLINKGLAQDVEQAAKDTKHILKEDPVSVTGSIGANTVLYRAYGIAPRRDPFYWGGKEYDRRDLTRCYLLLYSYI